MQDRFAHRFRIGIEARLQLCGEIVDLIRADVHNQINVEGGARNTMEANWLASRPPGKEFPGGLTLREFVEARQPRFASASGSHP